MNLKQPSEGQGVSWDYLPDTRTLLQYLNKRDLVEMSKCCKCYRDQLENRVFEWISLSTWKYKNWDLSRELEVGCITKIILKSLETDLGSKLKLVKKFELDFKVDCDFADIFVKLFPNVKALIWCDYSEWDNNQANTLTAILNSMNHLEYIKLCYSHGHPEDYTTKKRVFPKSLKSLNIHFYEDYYPYFFRDSGYYDYKCIYDTLDTSYSNLHYLHIISNRMLHSLSCGIPNLQEVKIQGIDKLDEPKLITFLKANPQLRKLETININITVEILKTIVSSKFLEYWYTCDYMWKLTKFNNLPTNYSIRQLKIATFMPSPLNFELINSFKSLIMLELTHYYKFREFDWSKLNTRINKLKLPDNYFASNIIKQIDSSRLFDQIHFYEGTAVKKFDKYIISKLRNYKFTPLTFGHGTLKLINKID
jgi:hypothetical protein